MGASRSRLESRTAGTQGEKSKAHPGGDAVEKGQARTKSVKASIGAKTGKEGRHLGVANHLSGDLPGYQFRYPHICSRYRNRASFKSWPYFLFVAPRPLLLSTRSYLSATRLTRSVPLRINNLPFTALYPDSSVNNALYPPLRVSRTGRSNVMLDS